jgi:NTP pyrophosphatase (non-canonical NTP hydrolase)
MDANVSLDQLRSDIIKFRDSHNWAQHDTVKNLAIAIAVESAELLDHFQWQTDIEIHEALKSKDNLKRVAMELADVFISALAFSHVLKIDISEIVRIKIKEYDENLVKEDYGP